MKQSLRHKVFRMNILLIAVAIVTFAILGIFEVRRFADIMEDTNREQNEVIMDTTSESMREMATENFQKIVVSAAKVLNGEFWTMRHDLEILARQVTMVLEQPSLYAPAEVAPPSAENAGRLTLQLLYSDNADRTDPEMEDQIRRIGGLGNMMLEIVEGGETLMDCMVSLPGGASIIVDSTPEGKLNADGSVQSYNADRRPWYVGALVHGGAYFSPVNRDNYYNITEVMAGVPVYVNGELAAVCGGSIWLDDLAGIIESAQLGEYTETCVINENGNIIYSTLTDGELGMEANGLKSLLESSNADLVALVREAQTGRSGFSLLAVDGRDTYVAYAPIETVGWTQLLTISQEDLNRTAYLLMQETDAVMRESAAEVRRNEHRTVYVTFGIAALLILCAVIAALIFSDRLVAPIKKMTLRVSQMQGSDIYFEVEDILHTGDEIEVLARAFADMSDKMRGYVSEIVRITAEKQRLDTELSVAADIQLNMLPSHFPAFPDRKEFDLYAVMDPAKEVGGDFYDFFLIDSDHLGLVMADVSGKGVPAALFMVISKTLIKNVALSRKKAGPAEILRDVNARLCEGNEDNMFVTAWLGVLTISTGELVSACAGHEYPVFYRAGKGFVLEHDPHGIAMGAMDGAKYREARWKLDPGDMLFLYTDGVPEANNVNEELFGNDRMLDALSGSLRLSREVRGAETEDLKAFLREMRRQVDDFAGEAPQFDDLTMMCVEYLGPASSEEDKL